MRNSSRRLGNWSYGWNCRLTAHFRRFISGTGAVGATHIEQNGAHTDELRRY